MFATDDFPLSPGDPGAESRRTRVKICGLTCLEDTLLALECGADALGFNFYPGSSRFLDLDAHADWLGKLPAGARRVGVVVNARRHLIDVLVREGLVDSVQLHGDEEEAFCAGLHAAGVPFSKAIRVRDGRALERPERFKTADLLLDAYQAGVFGGTGRRVDWTLAARFAEQQAAQGRRVILSGGLGPDNVTEAVRRVRPFAVDVASGVEEPGNPRRKDAGRMRGFFAAVRAADEETEEAGS